MKHTKGKWFNNGGQIYAQQGNDIREICDVRLINHQSKEENESNAHLIAAAPDRHQQMLALVIYGWEVDKVSLYDEEGIEGWRWTEPNGTEHTEVGDWSELPSWPDSARQAITKAEGGQNERKVKVLSVLW